MRRKLNRSTPTSEPSTPSATESAAPDTPVATATAEPALPAKVEQGPAQSGGNFALPAHLVDGADKFAPPAETDNVPATEDHVSFAPRIGFKSGRERSDQAKLIDAALGNAPDGTAYVQQGRDQMWSLGKSAVFLLDYFYFCGAKSWDDDAGRYTYEAAFADPQKNAEGRDKSFNGNRLSDNMITLCLVIGEDADDFTGATVQTFDGPRYHAGAKMLGAVRKSSSPEFAKANGETVAALPPQYRVAAEVYGTKPPGKRYIKASAVAHPIRAVEFERFAAWAQDEAAQQQLAEAREHFAAEVAEIQAVIDASPEHA